MLKFTNQLDGPRPANNPIRWSALCASHLLVAALEPSKAPSTKPMAKANPMLDVLDEEDGLVAGLPAEEALEIMMCMYLRCIYL